MTLVPKLLCVRYSYRIAHKFSCLFGAGALDANALMMLRLVVGVTGCERRGTDPVGAESAPAYVLDRNGLGQVLQGHSLKFQVRNTNQLIFERGITRFVVNFLNKYCQLFESSYAVQNEMRP